MAILKKSTDTRPVFLNLLQIHLPVSALVSITHRITGVIMIITLPLLLVAFLGVTTDIRFLYIFQQLPNLVVKLLIAALVVIYMLHILAGIRHIWHDFSGTHALSATTHSAYTVLWTALLWIIFVGWKLWC